MVISIRVCRFEACWSAAATLDRHLRRPGAVSQGGLSPLVGRHSVEGKPGPRLGGVRASIEMPQGAAQVSSVRGARGEVCTREKRRTWVNSQFHDMRETADRVVNRVQGSPAI